MNILKETAYAALDAVTFGKGVSRTIGGEVIRFPAKWSRYYEPDYEPETFRFFRENLHSGDTFLDIGAHIGLFTVLGARIVGPQGRVFSFEPTPFTRSVLQEIVCIVGIAIEFGCRDGGVAVTGVEQGDANHQGAGEAPGVTLCDGE